MNYLVPFIGNGVIGLLMSLYLMLVLHKKRGFVCTFLLLLLAMELMLVGCLVLYSANHLLQLFAVAALIFLMTGLLFSDPWPRRVLSISLALFAIVLCELTLSVILRFTSAGPDLVFAQGVYTQLVTYALYLSIYALLLWMFTLLLNSRTDRFSKRELLLYILFPVSQCLLTCGYVYPQEYGSNAVMRIVAIVVCFASDIGLYIAVRGMAQRAQLQLANERLAMQIEAQKRHYTALSDQYETIRRLRHDIGNHMYTIQALLDEGKIQEASKYASDLVPRHTFHASLGRCENPIVDAFLFSRVNDAQKRGVALECRMDIPAEMPIPNADLVIVFGNLLDNAEEACLGAGESARRIALQAAFAEDTLTVSMENPAAHAQTAPPLPGLSRGIGLHILESMAEKYHGALLTAARAGCFRTELTLRVPAEDVC